MNYGANYSPTSPPPMLDAPRAQQSSPIGEGLEMQAKLLSELGNSLDVLRARISPAIAARPVEAVDGRPKETVRAQSQLAACIENSNHQIAAMVRAVSNLIEGVEL